MHRGAPPLMGGVGGDSGPNFLTRMHGFPENCKSSLMQASGSDAIGAYPGFRFYRPICFLSIYGFLWGMDPMGDGLGSVVIGVTQNGV